ncbi:MAG: leucine-rich repeat protein [Lachnospiraceae bacterium]|nr:leucine-rich repeat protein [Lachnospiraceae bacterium]MBR4604790.1 leucine-rich repeat protein [Lachnospiraceae bacterium]
MKEIKKKQFMGEKSLRSYVIPMGTEEIGDWAFAGCRELVSVAIPVTVVRLGRSIFDGCEKLRRISWYQESGDEEDPLARLMAMALRYFRTDERIITLRKEGRDPWLQFWDEACMCYLESSDELGFQPFLAGGEEDYEDEKLKLEAYCRDRRLRKAEVLLTRLLFSENSENKSRYLSLLKDNDMAFALLMEKWNSWKQVMEVYEQAGLLSQENICKALDQLPKDRVELRAILLQKTQAQGMAAWTL